MNEVIREFLLETQENLAQLDTDLLALEKDPADRNTLARVFRTLHSVKGTAGFIGLPKLQAVAHAAESLLSRLRAGELVFDQPIASAILTVVDAIRQMLASIETAGDEGSGDYTTLIAELDRLRAGTGKAEPPAQPAPRPVPPAKAIAAELPAAPPPPASAATNAATYVGPAPDVAGAESGEPRTSAVADSSIRVDVGLLDNLMNLVGELVLARNQIVQYSQAEEDASFLATVQRLNRLTTELQAGVMKTRMQPIGNLWSKLPRVVRDLAVACGKQVRLEAEGNDTELDKTILETIRDPLTHIVRNAVDHGIETPEVRRTRAKPAEGRLALHAFHEGGKVVIEVADDGGGIDAARVKDKAIRQNLLTPADAARLGERELLNLIFMPGFSTAESVTQFSGRGVGMDVVRTNVERIGGQVELESSPGQGTTLRMKIPLTLAIIPALIVAAGGERYCIPQVNLLELVRLSGDARKSTLEQVHGAPVYRLRGHLLPLVDLREQLHGNAAAACQGEPTLVVLQADERQFGLIVEAIHDTEEIVVKPLQKQLKGVPAFAGATILGDGRVALILDVVGLARHAQVLSTARGRTTAVTSASTLAAPAGDHQALLLFSTTDGNRMGLPLANVSRLEEIPLAAIERVGNCRVVQYRGQILPLLEVTQELQRLAANGEGAAAQAQVEAGAAGPAHVVVLSTAEGSVGLLVGAILDIAADAMTVRSAARRPGVAFTAVVQDQVTEILDVAGLVAASGHAVLAKEGA